MKPLFCDFLCVEGIAPWRVLDKLSRGGVCAFGVRRAGAAALNFAVRCKDTEKVFAILRGSCYTVKKTGSSRAKRLLSAAARRPGIVCGALLFALLSFGADRLVLRIDVSGSAARYAARAEQLLGEAGIGVFSLYSEEAAGRARVRLLEELKDVAFAEVQKSGCVVFVTLEEGDVAEVQPRKSALTAPAAGVVEELTVLRGEALAEEGQTVSAGEVLVAGRIAAADGTYRETFVSARCVLRCEYRCFVRGAGETEERAAARAKLEAESALLQGDAVQLSFLEEQIREEDGGFTVLLSVRLVLVAGY